MIPHTVGILSILAAVSLCSCDRTKPTPVPESEHEISEGPANPGDAILAKLDRIIIPVIDFEDTTLWEAMDYLSIRAIELDRDTDPEYRGVSIVTKVRENDQPHPEFAMIRQLKRTDIPWTEALIESCQQANAEAYLTSVGFVICRNGQAPFPNFKAEEGEIWKKLTSP
ncbi:hypothetical protein [Haloferula sp. A504]|uniref:hypothetical protein n=1 Tax=Haloferula sp. A504 TaxID=3373601 RepID=UPI0031C088B8|nr:hypothetical protein [Verrucomicrobiaceae bacterium E54]